MRRQGITYVPTFCSLGQARPGEHPRTLHIFTVIEQLFRAKLTASPLCSIREVARARGAAFGVVLLDCYMVSPGTRKIVLRIR
jgi:hypothetical protein